MRPIILANEETTVEFRVKSPEAVLVIVKPPRATVGERRQVKVREARSLYRRLLAKGFWTW